MNGPYLFFLAFLINARSSVQQCQGSGNCKVKSKLLSSEDPYPKRNNWEQPTWLPIENESDAYVDLIFLVDGSGSVTQENFATIMEWIYVVSRSFDLSLGKFQVGLVQYSHWYRTRAPDNQALMKTEIPLGHCKNSKCFENLLDKVKLMGYTTYTGFAINKTVNEDFRNSKNFNESTKVLVLVTDGASADSVIEAANYARSNKIVIFAVGVGMYDVYELQMIATGDLFSYRRLYLLSEFSQLRKISGSLLSEIKSHYHRYVCPSLPLPIHATMNCSDSNNIGSKCTTTCSYGNFSLLGDSTRACHVTTKGINWSGEPSTCGVCDEKFDLLVILDSSSSVQCGSFAVAKDFVATLLDAFSIGRNHVQVSCMRYYNDVAVEFLYHEYESKDALKNAILNIGYCGKGTKTGRALRHAVDNLFSAESGRRAHVPHITLLITDGEARDNVAVPASQLKTKSVVFAIGLRNAKIRDIRLISSDPKVPKLQDIFPDYQKLMNVSLIWTIVKSFCDSAESVRNLSCNKSQLVEKDMSSVITCDGGKVPRSDGNESKTVGTTCTLECAMGFRTPGPSEAICSHEGHWERTNWKCIEKGCDPLITRVGSFISCTSDSNIESMCTSKCKPGYEIIPPTNRASCEIGDDNSILSCLHSCEKRNGTPKWDSDSVGCKKTGVCKKYTCKHGQCLKTDGEIQCKCERGYTGTFCEIDIDDCEEADCNNGTCIDEVDDFRCECNVGFEGSRCQRDINDCKDISCNDRGNCIDGLNSYKCECWTGYGGKDCEIFINECESNPCHNGGSCRDKIGRFECECAAGFTGKLCKTNINDCESSPCEQDKSIDCIDKVAGYECVCKTGWKGSVCHIDFNECNENPYNPCGEKGTCKNTLGSYTCICRAGYTGTQCEAEIDWCKSNPCKNEAICKPSNECDCQPGYAGEFCGTNINECADHKCVNGDCKDGVNTYTCECYHGYSGVFCDAAVNPCDPNPCGANGRCQREKPNSLRSTARGYYCECNKGFRGPNCKVNIDKCLNNDCQNEATCLDGINTYACSCKAGFNGHYCEFNIDDCEPDPCLHRGTCVDLINDYKCICGPSYAGKNCQIANDACMSSPCLNGAECITMKAGYRCECLHGYEGTRCKYDIDECRAQPPKCGANGQCINLEGDFQCNCSTGYYGRLCDKKHCQIPVARTKSGQMTCNKTTTIESGGECIIQCPPKWKLQDHRTNFRVKTVSKLLTRCNKKGIWTNSLHYFSGSPPSWECEPITCEPLEKIAVGGMLEFHRVDLYGKPWRNSHVINCTDGVNAGSVCDLKCHRSFVMPAGVSRIKTCNEDGSWTNTRWRCVQRKCLPPTAVGSFGKVTCFNKFMRQQSESDMFKPGSTCSLKCMRNFELVDKYNKTCNNAFRWVPSKLWRCQERRCDAEVPKISNGRYSCGDRSRAGSVCRVICDPGFVQDDRTLKRIICEEINGVMKWELIGPKGPVCQRSECEASYSLQDLKITNADYVSVVRSPYRKSSKSKSDAGCIAKSILAVNVTKGDTVLMELWYGDRIGGYHTVITTNKFTNGLDTRASSDEYLVSSDGGHLASSGFGGSSQKANKGSVTPDPLPVVVVANSRASVSLTFNSWKWTSKGGEWEGEIEHPEIGDQAWYMVYLGLNRVPNVEPYYDSYRNGTGLCHICMNKN